MSDEVFRVVQTHALYERPIPERHRIIFYIGHLEAFDWNLLHERVVGVAPFHPELDRLFAFGIDPVGGGLPTDQPSDWPSLRNVRDYVKKVRTVLDAHLERFLMDRSTEADDHSLLLNVAIEHRLMHAETLAYMLHQLPLDQKVPRTDPPELVCPTVSPKMVEIPAGEATLGLPHDGRTFGWDNEFETHTVRVRGFEIDQYQVSNQQFLEFIAAGGYDDRALWNDEDWNWKTATAVSHPVFWQKINGAWHYRTMFAEIPLPLNLPAYVSHAEASAYARWAGKSLPTEGQWHRAAYGDHDGERFYPWGAEAPDASRGNFDFYRWNPAPVNAFPRGRSAFGIEGMLGNGWEWTSTVFGPFAGFEPFPFYRGYSADFFDGKHFVMKGGSPRTAASMLRPTFRNWFQSHYQYAYAGFRCVSN